MAKGAKGQSFQAYAVKSKGMPGVSANKSASNKMSQSSKDLHQKFAATRRHA